MSRTKQTELQLKNQQFDLKESAEQWVSAFQSQAELEQKELTLSLDLPRPMVHGDPFRLQQLMGNLLSNALKFTHPGDKIQVEFSQPEEKICRILVRDTGIGISPEFLPQLFTPMPGKTGSAPRPCWAPAWVCPLYMPSSPKWVARSRWRVPLAKAPPLLWPCHGTGGPTYP